MTAPRQVLPGTTYLLTRRCSERRCFLRPSVALNELFLFVLSVAATRYGIRVHACCVLSNHYHLIVTDPDARVPEFAQYLDALVARAVNSMLGHFEGFWNTATTYSAVRLTTPDDVIAKIAYTLANPVAAGLVESGAQWPGICTASEDLGTATEVTRRPARFFRANGDMPETAELELTAPPGFTSPAAFQKRAARQLRSLVKKIRRERAGERRPYLGRARILAQDPFARPPRDEPRFRLSPRVAARDPLARAEALGREVEFQRQYRAAWYRRQDGDDDALFPPGTYLLRVMHRVRCGVAA